MPELHMFDMFFLKRTSDACYRSLYCGVLLHSNAISACDESRVHRTVLPK